MNHAPSYVLGNDGLYAEGLGRKILVAPIPPGSIDDLNLFTHATDAPHECIVSQCAGPANKLKLEAFDEMLKALRGIYDLCLSGGPTADGRFADARQAIHKGDNAKLKEPI